MNIEFLHVLDEQAKLKYARDFRYSNSLEEFINEYDIKLKLTQKVYICEVLVPKNNYNLHVSTNIEKELRYIPSYVKEAVNNYQALLVFNLNEISHYNTYTKDYELCISMIRDAGLNPRNIRILTMSDTASYWTNAWHIYLMETRNSTLVNEINLNPRDKIFTCLNRFQKHHRRYIVSELINNNLHTKSYVSYSSKKYAKFDQNDYGNPYSHISDYTQIDNLIPLVIDDMSDTDHNNHSIVVHEYFNNAYWNIVTESLESSEGCVLTEKTFKPIANLQPFILVGGYQTLKQLRKLGFKTFGNIIDEGYDTIKDNTERMKAVMKEIKRLGNMSHEEHITLMRCISPVLIHNKNHFLSKPALIKYLTRILR